MARVNRAAPEQAPLAAVSGNPNVGKSTLVNALTGLKQHTGNWPGKTVETVEGLCTIGEEAIRLADLPGVYSLFAHSAEEEEARDFLCFGGAQAVLIVCDGTCLERSLNLALQCLEILPRAVVCVNLMDEAARKGIRFSLPALQEALGVPVVAASARSRRGLKETVHAVEQVLREAPASPLTVRYCPAIERAAAQLLPHLQGLPQPGPSARWLSLRLLEPEEDWTARLTAFCDVLPDSAAVRQAAGEARAELAAEGVSPAMLQDLLSSRLVAESERLARIACAEPPEGAFDRDRKLDRLFTSRATGIPVMLLLLLFLLWLTISGANAPSALLSALGEQAETGLAELFAHLGAPDWLTGAIVHGMFRVLAWVVSVMLPPMAIFFPLFTLLEDFGYLPRVAFNLDHLFQKAHTCGKQALTMCMGFGCNAVGVTGCRIIDSPRERVIASVTNAFVPCKRQVSHAYRHPHAVLCRLRPRAASWPALLLTGVLLLGVGLTFLVSRLLSATVLRGLPSSFALELPPYRRPLVGQTIVRLHAEPHRVCARAGRGGGGSGGTGDLAAGKHAGGRREPDRALPPPSSIRSAAPSGWTARSCSPSCSVRRPTRLWRPSWP